MQGLEFLDSKSIDLDILKKCRLLYVEDEETVLTLFELNFKKNFKTLKIAKDGLEGLRRFKEERFDVVVTDISMPNMSGLEMLENISKIDSDVAKIVLTGYDNSEYLLEAIKLGVEGYLIKPYYPKNLLETIYKCYEKRYLKTELAQREQLLLAQSRQASLGEMISAIAHQWRQPLNTVASILHNIQTAQMFDKLTPKKLESNINRAQEQLQFMSNTIENFRNFFKPNREEELFLLDDAILESIHLVEEKLKNLSIEITLKREKELKEVRGYKNDFMQVILNIILNAKDAIVESSSKECGWIKIEIQESEKFYEVSILDNGGGMSEEVFEKLFFPYFTTKSEGKGTGVGLYMSKVIVERHIKGELYAKNHKDGAEFIICYPKDSSL